LLANCLKMETTTKFVYQTHPICSFLIALVCFVNLITVSCMAQTDTLFWFAAPDQPLNDVLYDRPIQLIISATDRPATVRIDQPANPAFTPIVLNLGVLETRLVNLTPWIDQIETRPLTRAQNTGLRIRANERINAYYEVNSQRNPDIFVLKGQNALGREFFAVFQTDFPNRLSNECYSAIDLVATEDGTEVLVNPSAAHQGGAANIPFTIRLSRGQTYSIRAASKAANQRLTGTRLTSNKPIAVSVKDDFAEFIITQSNQCADLVGDQLVPVDKLSTEYLVMPGGDLHQGDRLFIVSPSDNNMVYANGQPVRRLNRGESLRQVLNDAQRITSDLPIYVFHLTGMGCELSGALAPPVRCSALRRAAFVRPNNEQLTLLIAVPTSGIGNFTINGDASLLRANDFVAVPGTNGEWSWARKQFTTQQIAVQRVTVLQNSNQPFILGVLNGADVWTGTRFGYFSSYDPSTLDVFKLVDNQLIPINRSSEPICQGQSIRLVLEANRYRNILWSTGSASEQVDLDTPGTYWVSGTLEGCPVSDTIRIEQAPNRLKQPDIFYRANDRSWSGSLVVVGRGGTRPYAYRLDNNPWQTSSRFANLGPGTYLVQYREQGGCISSRSFQLR
jgi:hypothetical protein